MSKKPSSAEAIHGPSVAWRLELVREARCLFGVKAARQLWLDLGLPAVPSGSILQGNVVSFLDQATIRDTSAETPAASLYAAYQSWAESRSLPAVGPSVFGKMLSRAGVRARKSGSSIYSGLRVAE